MVGSGQGARAGQMTLPPKIFALAPWLQIISDEYVNFQVIRASVPTKRMSQNFDLGDEVRSM